MRDRILSLVSVQGTNGGQNHEKLIQYFIIPVCLMCWLSILSKLDCPFFYFSLFIMQYIDNQLITRGYLPMQNLEKIDPRISSVVISPVIKPIQCKTSLMSCASRSPASPDSMPSRARCNASRATAWTISMRSTLRSLSRRGSVSHWFWISATVCRTKSYGRKGNDSRRKSRILSFPCRPSGKSTWTSWPIFWNGASIPRP